MMVRITSIMDNIYANLYPIGSIYIGTQATCPLAALIQGSVWEIVGTNRALWCGNGSNANSTIDAGLPNIYGIFGTSGYAGEQWSNDGVLTGAFYKDYSLYDKRISDYNDVKQKGYNIGFDASRSNGIYGRSSTVQPDAYVVNVWRRIS